MDTRYIAVFIVLIVVLSALAGFGGYYFGINQATFSQKTNGKALVESSAIFQTQTASILGKVVKAEGDKITVVDQSNKEGAFPVSKKFVIYKPVKNSNQATPSSDLKMIDPTQQAFISLEVIDGKYQVVSITYLPPVLSNPPPAPRVNQ